MYIQITTRCNMTCEHCCMSCTAKGDDMGFDVFRAAMSLVEDHGSTITIGGGEPTLHPDFWAFLGMAALSSEEGPPWLATNGSVTQDALRLARLAQKGTVGVELSQDHYHDEIEYEVVEAFQALGKHSYGGGYKGTRDVSSHIIAQGRGADIDGAVPGCACESILVDPAGALWACGCKSHQLGTVFAPEIPDDWEDTFGVNYGECPNHGEKVCADV